MRSLPVLLLGVCLHAGALAQPLDGPAVVRERGITTLTFRGRLGDAAKGAKVARLASGERTALATPVEVGPDGTCVITLRTARLLLAGDYALELAASEAGPALARQPFRLGTEAEARAAEERMLGWYRGAAGSFRELTSLLERRGLFHRALADADAERRGEQEERLGRFLETWSLGLRTARMDLATYQRRVLLPPRPEAGAALLALVPLLAARAEAWRSSLEAFSAPPAPEPRIAAEARRLLEAIGEEDVDAALVSWQAGPLAAPRSGTPTPGQRWISPLGFGIDVPEGAELDPLFDPRQRLSWSWSGIAVRVEVVERPDAQGSAAMSERLEVDAWERWDSYKRLAGGPREDGAGATLEFQALFQGRTIDVSQTSLFLPGGRVASLYLLRDPTLAWPEGTDALLSSFRAEPGR